MPILQNARREAFCLALAEGESVDAAYARAGYKRNRKNAARLRTNDGIQCRVAELQERHAAMAAITVADVARMLTEDRAAALAAKQISAAVAASVALGKLFGLFIDKATVDATIRKPLREPSQLKQMSLSQWTERFAPKGTITDPELKATAREEAKEGVDSLWPPGAPISSNDCARSATYPAPGRSR